MKKWSIGIVILIILIAEGIYLLRTNKSTNSSQTKLSTPTTAQQTTSTMQSNTVMLTQDGFSPSTLTIKAGTTVTWTNKSGTTATVNSNPHPIHTDYPPLNLGQFSNGQSLTLTFNKAGTYGYHNHLNPSQLGTILVQ